MRGLQLSALLLLLILQVEPQAAIPQRQCSNLQASFLSCNNNSVLRVTKSTDVYQVTLLATEWQCYNDFCLLNHQRHRQKNILCNEICRACHQLKPEIGCELHGNADSPNCETNVDIYLNDFCAEATSTMNRATTCSSTATTELPRPTSTITVHTVHATVTVSPTFPHKANNINSMTSATSQTNVQCRHDCASSPSTDSQTLVTCKSVENYPVPLAALGALLGLSLLLLAVVVTGWVCTCRSMKKREARKSSRISDVNGEEDNNDDGEDESNEGRFFQNHIYDGTNTSTVQPYEIALGHIESPSLVNENVPETTYDLVNLPTQPATDNGQTYDVLNRSQANGGSNLATEVRGVHNNENYSQLQGLQEK